MSDRSCADPGCPCNNSDQWSMFERVPCRQIDEEARRAVERETGKPAPDRE